MKVEGQSLVNHLVVGRLTEIRTVRSSTLSGTDVLYITLLVWPTHTGDGEDPSNRPQAALPGR
jgi:hypothetical protein